jgi:hypothetical protein
VISPEECCATLNNRKCERTPSCVWSRYIRLSRLLFIQVTQHVTNCMEQSYLEKLSSSARQDTHRIWWNPKVHYRVHNSTLPVPYQSIIRSPITFSNTYSNIILQYTPRSFKSSFLSFPTLYVPHAPPISFSMIWAPKYYLINNNKCGPR